MRQRMFRTRRHGWRLLVIFFIAILLSSTTGCVGLLANLLHTSLGNLTPAQFEGLADRRVAVVAVSNSSSFWPTTAAEEIAQQVERALTENVKKIQIVKQQEIDEWMDRNDWNEINYQELGKGIGADSVVAIDVGSFSLHDGKTLFRGRADVEIKVYDISNGGEIIFQETPPQIVYPAATGVHKTDTSEPNFRRMFLTVLSNRIARYFYAYDASLDFGQEASDTLLLGRGA